MSDIRMNPGPGGQSISVAALMRDTHDAGRRYPLTSLPIDLALYTGQGPGSSLGSDGLDDQLQRVFQGLRIFRRVAFDFKNEPVAAQPPLASDQAG